LEFLGDAEWYIGIKFDWKKDDAGNVSCELSQEGYAAAILEEMGLSAANKSPLMTPFRSGFPIDAIPHVEMSVEDRATLVAKMQSWLGMMNGFNNVSILIFLLFFCCLLPTCTVPVLVILRRLVMLDATFFLLRI
jgi:hypothetical protein